MAITQYCGYNSILLPYSIYIIIRDAMIGLVATVDKLQIYNLLIKANIIVHVLFQLGVVQFLSTKVPPHTVTQLNYQLHGYMGWFIEQPICIIDVSPINTTCGRTTNTTK